MRSRRFTLCALAFVLWGALPSWPAFAIELAVPQARTNSGVGGMGGLTTVQQATFAQNLSQIVGQIGQLGINPLQGGPGVAAGPTGVTLESRQIVSFLVQEIGRPAPALRAQANQAVLAALWSSPEFSAAMVLELEKSGTADGTRAAQDLSALVRERRAQIDADRANILAHVPEMRRLSVPMSAAEFFDGMLDRRSEVEGPAEASLGAATDAAATVGAGRSRPHSRLTPSSKLMLSAPESINEAVPAVERSAQTASFLRRHSRFLAAYSLILGVSVSGLKTVTVFGHDLTAGASMTTVTTSSVLVAAAALSPVPLLLLQMAIIIGVGWLFSRLLSRVGQPAVIGQVIGGLALGPSLLGTFFPLAAAALFPAASLFNLHVLSQLGLIAFMFIVGQELDLSALKKQSGAAGLISHASIFIPFVLGAALSLFLFTGFAPVGVSFLAFSLFLGIAMSITAFPVLARILHERGMTSTPLGSLVLASAAIDDISGWVLLALVLAVATGGSMAAVASVLGLTVVYIAAMFGAVRPLLRGLASRFARRSWYRPASAAAYVLVLAVSALATTQIGIHALFGAFIAGMVMPRGAAGLSEHLAKRIQGISAAVLLPIFFALTGLRTHLDLLASPSLWGVAALVLAVAVAGKFGVAALAARWSGWKWRDSFSIGALMNTRGLMELVILNIGYERGIISGPLFAIFVLMAVATTMMTGPLLSLFSGKRSPTL